MGHHLRKQANILASDMTVVDDNPQFAFMTCQVGAEPALKGELGRTNNDWRLAFSRPGFLTFKLPRPVASSDDLELQSVFARSFGLSIGKVSGGSVEQLAERTCELVGDLEFDQLHVWPRDVVAPGWKGFEPRITEDAVTAREVLLEQFHKDRGPSPAMLPRQQTAHRGDRVLDCVLVEPEQWWIGIHNVTRRLQRWPGGLWPGEEPVEMVSRAYLKMAEALDWACWPLKPGQRCVELGCSPGGASQPRGERGSKTC